MSKLVTAGKLQMSHVTFFNNMIIYLNMARAVYYVTIRIIQYYF